MVGNITQPNGLPLANKNSKIYLLDIRSYTWVYTFEPSTSSNPSNSSTTSSNPSNSSTTSDPSKTSAKNNDSTQTSFASEPNQLTTMKIVIAAIGGVLGTIILIAIGIFGYKMYQKRQKNDIMRIYGNHGSAT